MKQSVLWLHTVNNVFLLNIEDTRNKRNEHEEDNEGKNDTNYLMLDCNKIHVRQKMI